VGEARVTDTKRLEFYNFEKQASNKPTVGAHDPEKNFPEKVGDGDTNVRETSPISVARLQS
jgi:hypothetical protein